MDVFRETLLTLEAAGKLFPGRDGSGVDYETVRQWTSVGRGGVRLASVKVGGSRYTSVQALERFVEALNRNDEGGDATGGSKSRRARPKRESRESIERKILRDEFAMA